MNLVPDGLSASGEAAAIPPDFSLNFARRLMLPPRIDTKAVQAAMGEYADEKETLAQRAAIYQELIGFVPPRGAAQCHRRGLR